MTFYSRLQSVIETVTVIVSDDKIDIQDQMIEVRGREREGEKSIFFRGYRYALRDQDTT